MYGTVYTHVDARIDSPVASLAASFMSWPVNGTSGLLQKQSSATLHGDALWNWLSSLFQNIIIYNIKLNITDFNNMNPK